jgi:cell division protein ZapA
MEKTIRVTILGREYPLRVEEEHELFTLRVAGMVDELAREVETQTPGHTPLTHMALTALRLAEELLPLRDGVSVANRFEGAAEQLSARLEAALAPAPAAGGAGRAAAAKRVNPSRKSVVTPELHASGSDGGTTSAPPQLDEG